jgi:outer membrane immunogenic protein
MRLLAGLVGAFAALALPEPGLAAELTPAEVVARDWSGIYAGANAGLGVGYSDWKNLNNTTLFGDALPGTAFSNRSSGIAGGVQFGVNFQSGPWVYGVEAMFDAADIRGAHTSGVGANDDFFNARIRALALGSARIGYAFERWLPYMKAGYAAGYVRTSVDDSNPPSTGSGKDNAWRFGPTVGLGLDYAATQAISFGLEYNYVRLDGGTYQLGNGSGSYLWDVDLRNVHLVLARISYRLGNLAR